MAMEETDKRCHTFVWRIENISHWEPDFHGRSIDTGIPLLNRTVQRLILFPKGENMDDIFHVRFFTDTSSWHIDTELSFLDRINSPIFTKTLRNQTDPEINCTHGCPTYNEVFVTKRHTFLTHDSLTIRFRIWKTHGEFECNAYYFPSTRINVTDKTFLCRIERFSSLQLDDIILIGICIPNRINLYLNFSLTGSSLEDAKLHFRVISFQTEPVRISISVSIVSEEEERACFETMQERELNKDETWNISSTVSRKEIIDRKSIWLRNDHLTLRYKLLLVEKMLVTVNEIGFWGYTNLNLDFQRHTCITDDRVLGPTLRSPREATCVEATCQTTPSKAEQTDHSRSSNSATVLVDDFLTLYKDQTLSDFELRSGEVSFPVHKNVLSARSPVFRAMFCGNMKEADSTSLDIPDVDPHALNRMLTFLYTGTLEEDLRWEYAAKLYYAADKYQVVTLKQECCSLLESSLSVSNVSDVLELADRHQDTEMTAFVQDFFLNHYDEIVVSDEWEKFLERNSLLSGKTMTLIYKKKILK